MLILRGLLVASGGMAFVFLPGAVIAMLTRRDLRFESSLLLWGMGILIVTLFPALFLASMLRLILFGKGDLSQPLLYVNALIGSAILALFLEGGKYLFLKIRKIEPDRLLESGMMIGLGIGVLIDVFHGINLMGSGFWLILGDTSNPDLVATANQPL